MIGRIARVLRAVAVSLDTLDRELAATPLEPCANTDDQPRALVATVDHVRGPDAQLRRAHAVAAEIKVQRLLRALNPNQSPGSA